MSHEDQGAETEAKKYESGSGGHMESLQHLRGGSSGALFKARLSQGVRYV